MQCVKTANKVGRQTASNEAEVASRLNDRYRLRQRIGEGASAEVFLADDLDTGEPCAVKLHARGEEAQTRRLLAEFARLGELRHRNVVRVRDVGRGRAGAFAGRPFLVTEHVPGPALDSLLDGARNGTALARFAAAADDLADALAYLHGRGLLHGDLSPANVRLDAQGRPILLDFGLSARLTGAATGAAAGTLGYLAPEALVGERTAQGDLYALGATLYAAWTGTPPFGVGLEAVRRAREGAAAPPSALRPGLPPAWDALLLRLLASAPEDRPAERARAAAGDSGGCAIPAALELALDAPQPQGDPLAGVFIGRSAERATLMGLVERLAEGASPANLVVVRGPAGSGRRTLIERVLRDSRVAVVAGALPDFDIDERGVGALLAELSGAAGLSLSAAWDEPARAAGARWGALAEALERRATARPLCVVLAPGPDEEALAEAVAGTDPSGRLLVVLASERAPRRPRAQVLTLAPLSADEVVALATRAAGEPPPEVKEALVRASAGQAALAALLVRRWVAALRAGQRVDLAAVEADSAALDWQLDASWAALSRPAQELVAARALDLDSGR